MNDFSKKENLIISLLCAYAALLAGIYYGSGAFVDAKDEKLSKQATETLDDFFGKDGARKYANLYYNSHQVDFEELRIPAIAQPSHSEILDRVMTAKRYFNKEESEAEAKQEILKNRKVQWTKKYDSYSKMYDLKVDPEAPTMTQGGWAIRVIERKPQSGGQDGYYQYYMFPSQIGYKKIGPFLSAPSVETAVQESLNFLINNENSSLKEHFVKGHNNKLTDEVDARVASEYYYILQDDDRTVRWIGTGDAYGPDRSSPVDDGSMFNGLYEVLFKKTQPTTYSVHWVGQDVLDRERKGIIIWGAAILTLVILIIGIPLWLKLHKEDKLKNETLHGKLLRISSPANFMEPYNKEMVDKANSLFVRIKEISPNDEEKLKEIRKEVSECLAISFIDKGKIAALKAKCSPKTFMKPYQPEKLSIANDLYSKLSAGSLSVEDVEKIEEDIKKLNKA